MPVPEGGLACMSLSPDGRLLATSPEPLPASKPSCRTVIRSSRRAVVVVVWLVGVVSPSRLPSEHAAARRTAAASRRARREENDRFDIAWHVAMTRAAVPAQVRLRSTASEREAIDSSSPAM